MTNNYSVKVYYHLDDSPTPYMSEVPVPSADRITLGDFRRVFTRKGYRYFCRRWDPELKSEVKAELVSDQQRLHRSANGLIELFLLSPAVGNADTLPRTGKSCKGNGAIEYPARPLNHHFSALALSSIASCSEMTMDDGCGGQRVSMVTGAASSDANTLISKRAGEHLAELYNSTSEDPYNRTSISSSGIFPQPVPAPSAEGAIDNSAHRTLLPNSRHRRNRKQRYRKPYVPSTISSASDESSYSLPRIEEVKLRLQEAPLGISVASQDGSIFIYNIHPGSAAENCGKLEVGDQIIQVEETRFEELSEKQALDLLRRLTTVKKTITLYVAKRCRANVREDGGSSSDGLSQLCETTQLDVSQWVESTKQHHVEPVLPFIDVLTPGKGGVKPKNNNEPVAVQHHPLMENGPEKDTSDEEQAAYLDRRNGVGPKLVPALQKAKLQQQLLRKCEELVENNDQNGNPASTAGQPAPSAPQPLHAAMDPILILRRMAAPQSGLSIRDRKWLKIPVPMSFIGDDMLDWLMAKVQGFKDRKSAKAFASTALAKGLIKHVVNINSFNEKCYFIFDDSIIAERLQLVELEKQQKEAEQMKAQQQQNQQNQQNPQQNVAGAGTSRNVTNVVAVAGQPESTTEITYMSSQSSPFFGPGPAITTTAVVPQLIMVNNPRYTQGPNILNQQALDARPNNPPTNGNPIPLRTLNPLNPAQFATKLPAWPISPIPRHQKPQNHEGCESPEATNDYASMIQGEINCGAQFDAQFDGFLAPKLKETAMVKGSPNFVNNNSIPPPPVLLPAPPVPHRQPK